MAKLTKITRSFNAGELDERMDARSDQQKYEAGAKTMENFIPLIYGGAQCRPGLEFIAAAKDSTEANKSRLVGFEHSVDDTYILEFSNQSIRFFTDDTPVLDGVGTETLTAVDGGNLVAHWLLNDTLGPTAINDDNPGTLDGSIIDSADSAIDASTVTATGKVGAGSFDLDGQYCVSVADAAGLSFTDNTDDEAFSLVCWVNITAAGSPQVLLSKWQDESTEAEYRFRLDENRKLQLHLSDTSANLSSDRVAQWKLNESAANTEVHDDTTAGAYPDPHDGVSTANTSTLTATGKTNMTPCFDFDGQYAVEIADAADLSFGNGTVDSPFSISAWVFVQTGTGLTQMILTKWDTATKGEWALTIDASDSLRLVLRDESASAGTNTVRYSNDALTSGWHFVAATYTGQSTAGATAADLITLYIDGSSVSATSINNASYDAMENLTAKVAIGAYYLSGSLSLYYQDKIDNVVVFDIEITASDVSALYNSGAGSESMISYEISSISDAAVDLGWHFLCSSYDATDNGSATAADGIIFYVDGVVVASTAANDANYGAMQDGGEEVRIGAQRGTGDVANEVFCADKIDEVSMFKDVLTPTEVASLYSTTPYEIETPYLTADLFELKFKKSADVMVITHPSYEPRKLSRTGDTE